MQETKYVAAVNMHIIVKKAMRQNTSVDLMLISFPSGSTWKLKSGLTPKKGSKPSKCWKALTTNRPGSMKTTLNGAPKPLQMARV